MKKIIEVKPLENYKIWIKFSDGVSGVVDLSNLEGRGVFKLWKNKKFFNSVKINPLTNTVSWGEEIDLCPDTLYAKIVGKKPLEILKH